MRVHVYMCVCVHMHVCMCVCVHACMCVCVCVCVNVCAFTSARMHECLCVRVHMHVCVLCVCVCMCCFSLTSWWFLRNSYKYYLCSGTLMNRRRQLTLSWSHSGPFVVLSSELCPSIRGKEQHYLCIYLRLIAQSAHRVTSGIFTSSNLTQVKYNTTHAQYINVKHTNIIQKLIPLVLLL